MSYKINQTDKSIIVEIEGEFDAVLAKKMQEELENIECRSVEKIIFDLSETEHMASSGLRVIIFAEERLNPGNVIIKNPQDFVMEIIKMSGIDAFVTLVSE